MTARSTFPLLTKEDYDEFIYLSLFIPSSLLPIWAFVHSFFPYFCLLRNHSFIILQVLKSSLIFGPSHGPSWVWEVPNLSSLALPAQSRGGGPTHRIHQCPFRRARKNEEASFTARGRVSEMINTLTRKQEIWPIYLTG